MAPGPPLLLGLDVDGTLLTSSRTVSDRTRAALRAAHAVGWHVVVVTGRPLALALPVVQQLGVGDHVVAANGATVAEAATGRVLHQATLPGPLARAAVLRARAALPGLGVTAATGRGFEREAGFEVIAPLSHRGTTLVGDATPRADDEVHSLLLFRLGMEVEALASAVAAVVPAGVAVSPSGLAASVELTPPGVHKATGVELLCGLLGMARQHVVAFGDGLNDVELLRWAGWGVAMGNADDTTKSAADEVTATNDDDGVALVVERLLDGHG